MRNAIISALVLASAPASAQPVTRPCAVTIARAPDDVRIVVDAWVAAEPACGTPLEVRIIPTEGGLYLLARDDQGRVRERIVPDAQSAGVLIASWAADDAAPVLPAPAVAPGTPVGGPGMPVGGAAMPMATPIEAVPVVAPGTPSMAPGMITAPMPMPVDGGPPPAPRKQSKWISIGGLVGEGDDGGLRLEVDVLTRGKWSFGVAGSASVGHTWVSGLDLGGEMTTSDKKVTATVTRNMQAGRFQLRASAGLGVAFSEASALLYPYDATQSAPDFVQGDDVSGVADASLLLGIEFGKNWAITGGPVVTVYDQAFEATSTQMTWEPLTRTIARQNVEVMGFAGLRYRL